jgi:hypothetical protein
MILFFRSWKNVQTHTHTHTQYPCVSSIFSIVHANEYYHMETTIDEYKNSSKRKEKNRKEKVKIDNDQLCTCAWLEFQSTSVQEK